MFNFHSVNMDIIFDIAIVKNGLLTFIYAADVFSVLVLVSFLRDTPCAKVVAEARA